MIGREFLGVSFKIRSMLENKHYLASSITRPRLQVGQEEVKSLGFALFYEMVSKTIDRHPLALAFGFGR